MELYDVMRTTFAAREFTDTPLPESGKAVGHVDTSSSVDDVG